MQALSRFTITAALLALAGASHAADWSDTSMGFRFGDKYAEPFNTEDIAKKIVNFTHVSGYKYGSNFFNADFLMSDDKDPSSPGGSSGAAEVYVVYRHTLDIGKVTGSSFKYGPMRGFGVTAGFDFNVKDDAGYNSKKRMFVAGPTVMMDVPGFLNISLLALWESNAPQNEYEGTSVSRYDYDVHPMLNLAWGIPIGAGFSFEGFANFIASKGDNEFGGDTAAETNIDMQVMYDLSNLVGAGKGTFKAGIEYQYWKNKFGNDAGGIAGPGATAKTPQIRVEYHF
jgi:nucleoside-specific outer membrane channel protein Tsx